MAYIGEGGVKQLAVLINNRYITADAVDTKISDAVKDIAGFKTEVVASLPTTGVEGTIYFAPSSNAEDGNSYDEFIWIASQTKFEQVGSTQVDLDDYAKTENIPTKVSELTNDSGFLTQHQSLEGYAKTDDLYDPDNKDTLAKLSTSNDGTLLFDGSEIKGGGDTVEVTQTLTTGTEIGSIKVGDETTVLYAPEGGSGGSTEVENMYINIDRYTEDEIVIGEYMGKPLYRKVIPVTSDIKLEPNKWVSFGDVGISDIEDVIKTVFLRTNNPAISTNASHDANITSYVKPSDRSLYILNTRTTEYTLVANGAVVIIEYTKSTDPENSFDKNSVLSTVKAHGVGYENYSEEEIVIGKWVDGKPIYKITKRIDILPNSIQEEYLDFDDILDVSETIVNVQAWASNGSNIFMIPMVNATNSTSTIGFHFYKKRLVISTGTDRSNYYAYFTVEYTKTTDAPNSFNPSMVESGYVADGNYTDAEVSSAVNNIFGGEN